MASVFWAVTWVQRAVTRGPLREISGVQAGSGLCPRPLPGVDGGCNRICRGRPVCRPVDSSLQDPFAGGHIGPPLRGAGVFWNNGEQCEDGPSPAAGCAWGMVSASQIPKRNLGRRGEVTPPYGSATGGAQQRADVPKAWLPPTKFRTEIWGVSHGHRPLRIEGEAAATTPASSAQRSVCGADGRKGWKSEQRASPKCPATSDNPSVSLRLTAPFAQGSLRDGRCGSPCRPVDSSLQDPFAGGHIGPPLRGAGVFRNNGEQCENGPSPAAGCGHPALRVQRWWCPAAGRCA